MNARAPIRRVDMGKCPVSEVLDITGFNMNDVLDVIRPSSMTIITTITTATTFTRSFTRLSVRSIR